VPNGGAKCGKIKGRYEPLKKLFGALVLCGFLAASLGQAATQVIHPKAHQSKAAQKQAKKIRKQNAKARKAAKTRKAQVKKAA
jgi:hypothetical protein